MGKIIITVGDLTTHGGTVLVGDPTILIEGKPVARIGSTILYPLCKIPTVIVQGATLTLVNNIPVARHGDPTSCGAKLVSTRAEPACTVHVGNNVHIGSGVVHGSGVIWAPSSGGAPTHLNGCEQRIAEARERLKKEGYTPKYTDGASGAPPSIKSKTVTVIPPSSAISKAWKPHSRATSTRSTSSTKARTTRKTASSPSRPPGKTCGTSG